MRRGEKGFTSENHFTTRRGAGVPAQPEGKDRLINQLEGNDVVPQRNNLVYADPWPCQTQDAIKLSGNKGETRFIGGLINNKI